MTSGGREPWLGGGGPCNSLGLWSKLSMPFTMAGSKQESEKALRHFPALAFMQMTQTNEVVFCFPSCSIPLQLNWSSQLSGRPAQHWSCIEMGVCVCQVHSPQPLLSSTFGFNT